MSESAETGSKKRWYVLKVATGFEKSVTRSIAELAKREGLESFLGEVLVPTESVVEMGREGKKRRSQRKFFPGYILLEVEMNDDVWYKISSLPKVSGFVGGSRGNPVPISKKEVQTILDQMVVGEDSPKPKVLFEPGEVVQVTHGPFADFSGVVETVNYEKSRLKVSVLIFGRSTPVELEFSQVEKQDK